jgi:hypothetical protein
VNEELWFVRSRLLENGIEAILDEGPLDRWHAELLLADIGIDASIPRGLGRVQVVSASLVSAGPAWLYEVL